MLKKLMFLLVAIASMFVGTRTTSAQGCTENCGIGGAEGDGTPWP